MIELRWKYKHGLMATSNSTMEEQEFDLTLQYRLERQGVSDGKIVYAWTEWTDVPLVDMTEETNETTN